MPNPMPALVPVTTNRRPERSGMSVLGTNTLVRPSVFHADSMADVAEAPTTLEEASTLRMLHSELTAS